MVASTIAKQQAALPAKMSASLRSSTLTSAYPTPLTFATKNSDHVVRDTARLPVAGDSANLRDVREDARTVEDRE